MDVAQQNKDHNEEHEASLESIKKYFGKDYNTLYVKIDEDASTDKKKPLKNNKIADLITLLTESAHKEVREEVFKILKNESGLDLLIEAIQDPRTAMHKSALVAACWEAGIDCSQHLAFFNDLAIHDSYSVSLEAITVIQNMEGPFDNKDLSVALAKVEKALKSPHSEKHELIQDLKRTLVSFQS